MSEASKPVVFATGRPEQEIAAELRAKFEAAMKPALSIMDEAARAGLTIQFNSLAPAWGKYQIEGLRIMKVVA